MMRSRGNIKVTCQSGKLCVMSPGKGDYEYPTRTELQYFPQSRVYLQVGWNHTWHWNRPHKLAAASIVGNVQQHAAGVADFANPHFISTLQSFNPSDDSIPFRTFEQVGVTAPLGHWIAGPCCWKQRIIGLDGGSSPVAFPAKKKSTEPCQAIAVITQPMEPISNNSWFFKIFESIN